MYETKKERDALFSFTGKFTEVDLLNKEATGFGWAVLVRDNLEDDQLKVIKLPNRDETTQALLAEAQILTKISRYLRHPNLISLFSVERYVITWGEKREERYFVVLEFGGKDLRKRLGRLGMRKNPNGKDEYVYQNGAPLPLEEVLRLGIQVTDGLRALHEFEEAPGLHIVHRDIKPENILVDDKGVARLTDFGISRVVERLTQNVTVGGTWPYLAPEYSMGRFTGASDIYSLGIVLYEMATGHFPFKFHEDRFLQMPVAPHLLNPAIPPNLSEVILKSLWWDPGAGPRDGEAQRYRSAGEMLRDLRRCLSRLYPVPPQYTRLEGAGAVNLYRDKETGGVVRVHLYETKQAHLAGSHLVPVVQLRRPDVVTPLRTFDADETIGVVVPGRQEEVVADPSRTRTLDGKDIPDTTLDTPAPVKQDAPPLAGQDVYQHLPQVIGLCKQLEALHRYGIYHGFLSPHTVCWDKESWVIDRPWLGTLLRTTPLESIAKVHPEVVGYAPPELLREGTGPTLASDIYGVAAYLYGRVTGRPPLTPSQVWSTIRGETGPPTSVGGELEDLAPTVPRRLQNILLKALHADPGQRYPSLGHLVEDLLGCRWPEDVVGSLVDDARDLYRRGLVVEAYDALDRAQKLAPGHEDIHHARAEIYFREGEYRHALKENMKALNILPTPGVCFLHGQCLVALGRFDEALDCYREGLRLKDCSLGRHLLAQCLQKMGMTQRAVTECREALRIAEFVERDAVQVQSIRVDLEALISKAGA